MKRILSLILAFTVILSLCACQGNFGSVDLNAPIAIPGDGIVKESTLKQLQAQTAIGIFTGSSGDYSYEWTVFGTDVATPKDVNLHVRLTETADGSIKAVLSQKESFGFSALLSVYLNELWDAQSATAYAGEKAVASVSLTGSKATILNLSLDGSVSELTIRPDPLPEDALPAQDPTVPTEGDTTAPTEGSSYLSKPQNGDQTVYTDGKDKYLTDPVPAGKPQPVEPEDQQVNTEKALTCTFSIECSTIFNNLDMLDPAKLEMLPSGGVILAATTVSFHEGESVFDVLQRVCRERGIHLEASWTPVYNSAYIEGIHNLYELDCGSLSGWMYRVNGWYPNYGCSRYQLKDGDVVQWRFTCDLGKDVGGGQSVGG